MSKDWPKIDLNKYKRKKKTRTILIIYLDSQKIDPETFLQNPLDRLQLLFHSIHVEFLNYSSLSSLEFGFEKEWKKKKKKEEESKKEKN